MCYNVTVKSLNSKRRSYMEYLYCTVIGYLFGCLSPSYIISRIKNVDLREKGTGNLGATNTTMSLGRKFGVIVMIIDILKAFAAVKLCLFIFEIKLAGVIAGTCAMLGHMFPFYLKFKGGKGLACFGGFVLALNIKQFLLLLIIGLVLSFVFNYGFMIPLSASLAFPVLTGIHYQSLLAFLVTAAGCVAVLCRHRENIRRIKDGTEVKFRVFFLELFSRKK